MQNKLFTTRNMTKIAILSVLAFLLMFFNFPIPFIAPPFYKIDLSEIPVLIGGFAISPLASIIIELFKNILNVLFEGSSTAFVGELSNFISGSAFCFSAAMIYHLKKDKKHAILGLLLGVTVLSLVGFISNYYFIIPAYVKFMNIPLDTIVGMGQKIFPFIDSKFALVLFCTTPFNIIKGLINSVITTLIYKYISPIIKRF